MDVRLENLKPVLSRYAVWHVEILELLLLIEVKMASEKDQLFVYNKYDVLWLLLWPQLV